MALTVKSGGEAVKKAKSWIGTPYCWGGGHGGPVPVGTCVDCSGLVNQVYGTTGNTGTQVMLGQGIGTIQEAGPGDLVFFGPLAPAEPHHVGIYTGNNQMIDAPHTGTQVRQESISGFGSISAIRRLVPPGTGDNTSGGATGPIFTYAQLEGIWILAGGNAQTAAMAAAIAMAESGGNANASNVNTNGTIDRGLWQINNTNGSGSSFDVMTNTRTAIRMSNNGASWRPWCTAYSDGACGSRGGCYQCPGSPYLKFLNTNIPPDQNVNVNATNAAANIAPTDAQLTSILGDNPFTCILDGPQACFNAGGSSADALAGGIIKSIMHLIINPLIQPIAGALGIAGGAILVIGGIYVIVSGTRAGAPIKSGVGAAFRVYAPETGIGMSAGERTAYRTQQTAGMRIAGRERLSGQQAQERREAAETEHTRRMEAMSTQQLLDLQAMAYREYLRRTRSGSGGPTPRPRPNPQRSIPTKTGPR
jgi:hypothetical protein